MSGTLHWTSVVELSQPGDTKCSSLSLTKPVTLWMSSAEDFSIGWKNNTLAKTNENIATDDNNFRLSNVSK